MQLTTSKQCNNNLTNPTRIDSNYIIRDFYVVTCTLSLLCEKKYIFTRLLLSNHVYYEIGPMQWKLPQRSPSHQERGILL